MATMITVYNTKSSDVEEKQCDAQHYFNKKLSYRRETARQPSSSLPLRPLWLHLCVWSNPKSTTHVRQACRPL